eukprot:7026586-Prymnesium_polylepis.1
MAMLTPVRWACAKHRCSTCTMASSIVKATSCDDISHPFADMTVVSHHQCSAASSARRWRRYGPPRTRVASATSR